MRRQHPCSRLWLVLVSAALLGLFTATATAQGNPDIEKAKQHYIAAEAAMQSGDYAKAQTGYQAAYDITKDPVLFYKLATAHEKAGECDKALTFYRQYLAEGKPDETFKALTEERIAACEAGVVKPSENVITQDERKGLASEGVEDASEVDTDVDAGESADTGDATDTSTEDPLPTSEARVPMPKEGPPSFAGRGPTWKGKVAWSSLAVALGFGTVSAVLALSASSQEQDLENLIAFRDSNGQPAEYSGTVRTRYEDFVDKGKTHATWSRIALGAAGLSVAAAATFFLWDRADRKAAEREASIVPVISPESVGLAAGWRF